MRHGIDYGLPPERIDRIFASHAATGSGYEDYPGQQGYGVSRSAPDWIVRELAEWQEARVVAFAEKACDDHQDVLAVQRPG